MKRPQSYKSAVVSPIHVVNAPVGPSRICSPCWPFPLALQTFSLGHIFLKCLFWKFLWRGSFYFIGFYRACCWAWQRLFFLSILKPSSRAFWLSSLIIESAADQVSGWSVWFLLLYSNLFFSLDLNWFCLGFVGIMMWEFMFLTLGKFLVMFCSSLDCYLSPGLSFCKCN